MSINIGNIGSTVKRAKGFVNGSLDSFRNGIGGFLNITNQSGASDGEGGNVGLMFPPDMRGKSVEHLPLIEFKAYERNPSPGNTDGAKKPGTGFHTIYLPINSSIEFSDSATYNTINLDSIGAKVAQTVNESGMTGSDILSSIGSAAYDAKGAIVAKYIPGGAGDYVGLKSGVITNPNTNTAFEGNGIRSFSFNFKLVAKSQEESQIIRKIHETFRFFSYADLNTEDSNLFISYPAQWTIRFLDMGTASSGQENQYIPGIWSCYLTSVGSTFNASSNMYFSDNAPIEVDISLTFQETRVLNRNDMMKIKTDPLRGIIKTKPVTPPGSITTENIEVTGGN